MSNNSSTIFVFGKGHKGRCGYLICDNDFKPICQNIEEGLLNDKGELKAPANSDYDAIIKSLEYIRDNRGNSSIPSSPVVFLFTSFENTYHVCSKIKKADPDKTHMVDYVKNIRGIMLQLQRAPRDDNVQFLFIPKKFENHMELVDEMLASTKHTPPAP